MINYHNVLAMYFVHEAVYNSGCGTDQTHYLHYFLSISKHQCRTRIQLDNVRGLHFI